MKQTQIRWYESYEATLVQLRAAQAAFQSRCEELGQASDSILAAFQRELLARTVHESNWQEGVELDYARTRELSELVMDDLRFPEDGRLDLQAIADLHRAQVIEMKRRGANREEVATLSLARAHTLLRWVAQELAFRQTASLAFALSQAKSVLLDREGAEKTIPPELQRGFEIIGSLKTNPVPAYGPMQGSIGTEGELLARLLEGRFETLLRPMDVRYIHGLHRIAMMGVIPSNQLGRWRRSMVHVGNPDIVFPPPEALEALMTEFCEGFPPIIPTAKYDPVRMAARVSYRFVRIHPYLDGNGRVSRLLMNLVLCPHHPMVSLAPRAKERHRYRTAIRRADRGMLEPLQCLVAMSVRETYERMLAALGSGPTRERERG
jgi:fido (protein-threonine AMPylation protein)